MKSFEAALHGRLDQNYWSQSRRRENEAAKNARTAQVNICGTVASAERASAATYALLGNFATEGIVSAANIKVSSLKAESSAY